MYDGYWGDFILNNLWIPIILVAIGIILKILQHYADKFVELFTSRQKTESMEKIASVREKLVVELDKNVEAAVASNMDMVDKMKAAGHKLDEQQIREINDSTMVIIMKSLPSDICGMTPADILGGELVMNSMINSLREKYVLEYKIKRGQATAPNVPVTSELPDEIDCTAPTEPFFDNCQEPAPMDGALDISMDPIPTETIIETSVPEMIPEEPVYVPVVEEPVPEPIPEPVQEPPAEKPPVTGVHAKRPLFMENLFD